MIIYTKRIETPIGTMIAGVNDQGIFLLDFPSRSGGFDKIKKRIADFWQADFEESEHKNLQITADQLNEYFNGSRRDFDLPIQFSGTPFQQKVWNALLQVPYASTRSYMQQSLVLGDAKATRAVAKANGENALSIIVPCHRIIGSNGSLTGYAGGLEAKKWLLDHEQTISGGRIQSALF